MGKQRSAVEHTSAAEAATWAIAGGTAEAVPSRKSRSRDMAKAVPSQGLELAARLRLCLPRV